MHSGKDFQILTLRQSYLTLGEEHTNNLLHKIKLNSQKKKKKNWQLWSIHQAVSLGSTRESQSGQEGKMSLHVNTRVPRTCFQSPEPTWKKKRTDLRALSSDLHIYTVVNVTCTNTLKHNIHRCLENLNRKPNRMLPHKKN